MSGLRTYRNFSLSSTPPLTSKVAIVTGGSDGVGKEIVLQLLLHNISKIYVLSRKQDKFDQAKIYWMRKGIDLEGRVEFISCDLNDMLSVKKVADFLVAQLSRLDILINNAGTAPLLLTLSPHLPLAFLLLLLKQTQPSHHQKHNPSHPKESNLYGQPTS